MTEDDRDKQLLLEIAGRLNKLVLINAHAIQRLIEKRVSCGSTFKDSKTVTVSAKGHVGLLGILNGLRKSNKYVLAACYGPINDDELDCFMVLDTESGEHIKC